MKQARFGLVSIATLTIFASIGMSGCASSVDPVSGENISQDAQSIHSGTVVGTPVGVERAIVRVTSNGRCTGTLLNSSWVITARHCIKADDTSTSESPILNGTVEHFPSGTTRSYPAANVVTHPDKYLDIALIHLPSPIVTGQTSVSIFGGADSEVLTHFVRSYGYAGSVNTLRSAWFTASHIVQDSEMHNDHNFDGKYWIIPPNTEGQYTEHGDSGGPTFLGTELVATTGGGNYFAYTKRAKNWTATVINECTTAPGVTRECRAQWFRYYHPTSTDHFYTTSWDELGEGRLGYVYEGVEARLALAQQPGTVPFYRSLSSLGHFYSLNNTEGANLGYQLEGVTGYVYTTQQPGSIPLYQYYNEATGSHFYTTNFSEIGSGKFGWVYEKIVAYVFPR